MSKPRPTIKLPARPLGEAPPATTPELADLVRHEEPATSRPLTTIRPHPSPSRALDARHVLDMARSIAALGLIHPIAIDLDGVVLAGSHRFAALRILTARRDERLDLLCALCDCASKVEDLGPIVAALPDATDLDPAVIPVRIMPLRLALDPEGAWRVEVAENERRKDYKPTEVKAIAERLKSQGYHLSKGPAGSRPLALPVLTALVGRSERQVRRMLSDEGENRTDGRNQFEKNRQSVANALEKFLKSYTRELTEAQRNTLRKSIALLDSLAQ